jgi:hypothetical protein
MYEPSNHFYGALALQYTWGPYLLEAYSKSFQKHAKTTYMPLRPLVHYPSLLFLMGLLS